MNRQVANVLEGQVQYPAQRIGFLQQVTVGIIIGIVCLSVVACQPLAVPADTGAAGSSAAGDGATGSETTLSAPTAVPAEEPAAESAPEAAPEAIAAPAPEEGQGEAEMRELSPTEQMLVELAQSELAAELGIAPDQIKATSMQAVDFSDSSLGCPEEGMMYAQVITSGYAFMLEADGTSYEYHGSGQGNGHVVRCKSE